MSLTDEPGAGLTEQPTSEMVANEHAVLRADSNSSKSPSEAEQPRGQQQVGPPAAWLIRAGGRGEQAQFFIENSIAAVGFGQLPDLSEVSSREEMVALVKADRPESSDAQARVSASQLWTLLSKIRRGDLVVMPRRGNSEFALGTVTREYWYRHDAAEMRHAVRVDWKRSEVSGSAMGEDLLRTLRLRQTVNSIRSEDAARRLQQVLETGLDPGPRAGADNEALDLSALVDRFYSETGFPTDAHEEQERLREEWARKLAAENVTSLSREDLLAYTSNAVIYGQYVTLKEGLQQEWIDDLDPAGYNRLLVSVHDLCWGEDELSTRIDRLVKADGSSRQDTGTTGFAQGNLSATLAICHPDRFLPVGSHGGHRGRTQMLRTLGLPEPRGSTFGQRMVDSHSRLREHLAPHLGDDPQAIACFLYWLTEREIGSGGDADLSALVERFRAESGYRTEAHEEQERLRAEWAEKLAPENIANFSPLDLTGVASNGARRSSRYVYPHVRGVMQWIRALDDAEYSRMLDHIRYLCSGEGELWRRYDQLTDSRSDRSTKGLKQTTTSKLLAICYPEDFLPIGQQGGKWGRGAMLSRLGLSKPTGSSLGQRVVDANNRLREHLEPHFGDDTLGMGAFLEWLLEQEPTGGTGCPPEGPVDLTKPAGELLVDVDFLKDIVSLLEDKGQVILYGPPGTGKTYLARALAKALAPDEACRTLVQFHPSTSYEDFFEGYRPAGTDGGAIQYKLTHGPLALMADQADDAPDKCHVMIIDEINRANLPRVLGELLFLLEYRDENVQTLYRPDEEFSLPENLWFIGTMNTADRSIALVDAALRRRFHFVPFFPDNGPMAGLLARWLKREGEPAWVGNLVDAVNAELKKELEGSDLLLGSSHFMTRYGSSLDTQRRRLRRIWEYNIEPFIEDQFFGDPDRIEHFRFKAVMDRHGLTTGSDVDADDDRDDPGSADGSESEHAAAEGDAAAVDSTSQPGDEG